MTDTSPSDINQDAGNICGVADALQEGDEVYVGNRSRPITVIDRDQDLGITPIGQASDYPYEHIWFEGNGTQYRLRYSHQGNNFPSLYTRSQLTESTSNFQHPDFDGTMVSQDPTLMGKMGEKPEWVYDLIPKGVETQEELADWVQSRLIEVVDS